MPKDDLDIVGNKLGIFDCHNKNRKELISRISELTEIQ